MIRCEDKFWGEVMCEKQKNLSEKLQLGMYSTLKNPCCGGWKISWGRLLLNNLLGSLSSSQPSGPPCWTSPLAFGLIEGQLALGGGRGEGGVHTWRTLSSSWQESVQYFWHDRRRQDALPPSPHNILSMVQGGSEIGIEVHSSKFHCVHRCCDKM
jgi:hypothetical protein